MGYGIPTNESETFATDEALLEKGLNKYENVPDHALEEILKTGDPKVKKMVQLVLNHRSQMRP